MWRSMLVLAPHPDDEVLGCGGLVAKMAGAGARVTVGVFASCSDERLTELFRASRLLGFEVEAGDSVPGFLSSVAAEEVVGSVERMLEPGYDVVAVPQAVARHQEHRWVREAAVAALRPRGALETPPLVIGYELTTDHGARADLYVELNEVQVGEKCRAMTAHRSQLPDGDSERAADAITALARYRGAQAGVRYAEAYEVVRWIA